VSSVEVGFREFNAKAQRRKLKDAEVQNIPTLAPLRPRVKASASGSGNFDLHLPDFVFNRPVERMFAELAEVRVAGEPFEIVVTKRKRLVQGSGRQIEIAVQGVTAGQIVKNEWVARLKAGQSFVHFKAEVVLAALRVMIAENLEGFDVFGVSPDNSFHESNFNVKVSNLFAAQLLTFDTTLHGHTTD
jgi:hypothetical protein